MKIAFVASNGSLDVRHSLGSPDVLQGCLSAADSDRNNAIPCSHDHASAIQIQGGADGRKLLLLVLHLLDESVARVLLFVADIGAVLLPAPLAVALELFFGENIRPHPLP